MGAIGEAGGDIAINVLVGYAAAHGDQYHTFMISPSLMGSKAHLVAVSRYQTSSRIKYVELMGVQQFVNGCALSGGCVNVCMSCVNCAL